MSGTTAQVLELPEIARYAMERQRTAAIFDELVRTVRGEYGPFDRGLCVPTWEMWQHTGMDRHRERIEALVASSDDPAEALWQDLDLRNLAHDIAHERCCAEASEHSTDAFYELEHALDVARDDENAGPPQWLTGEKLDAWHNAVAELRSEIDPDERYDLISTLLDDGPLGYAIEVEGCARHQNECPRGSVTGPSGWIHPI